MRLSKRVQMFGLAGLVAAGTLVSACQATPYPTETVYPTDTPVVVATDTAVPPSPVPVETDTPVPDTHTPTNTPVPPTPTYTVVPDTPTPVHLYSFSGVVFHDSGNGVLDLELPGNPEKRISGLEICLDNVNSGLCGFTDVNGYFNIASVPAGQHQVLIQSDKFTHYNKSLSEIVTLEFKNPQVIVNSDIVQNFGLSEGPAPLPIKCEQRENLVVSEEGKVVVTYYFDVDRTSCPEGANIYNCPNVRDFMGGRKTFDQHPGTDIRLKGDVRIVASLPGVVSEIGQLTDLNGQPSPNDYHVYVRTNGSVLPWVSNSPLLFGYSHLQEVSVRVGQRVSKGDQIGFVKELLFPDYETYKGEHVHLSFYYESNGEFIPIDPFKDSQNPKSHNLWPVYNTPACF